MAIVISKYKVARITDSDAIRQMEVNALIFWHNSLPKRDKMKNNAEIAAVIAPINASFDNVIERNISTAENRNNTAQKAEAPLSHTEFGVKSVAILFFGMSIGTVAHQRALIIYRASLIPVKSDGVKYPISEL